MTQGHKDTRNKRIIGFTLMELMVVIGIISIVGVMVGPGLKKAYEDFKIKETIDDLFALQNACRSHYLILNEFPENTTDKGGMIGKTLGAFCPSYFFYKTLKDDKFYQLKIVPYGGTCYDINNWLTWENHNNGRLNMWFKSNEARKKFINPVRDRYVFADKDKGLVSWKKENCLYLTDDNSLVIYFPEVLKVKNNYYQ